MNSRVFTCILCPNGCEIEVCHEDGRVLETEGNKCKKGQQYVEQELTDPRRTIASSVRIKGSFLPLCSVRLTKPVPKQAIFSVMEEINKAELTAPVRIGEIVIRNVCGLESDVIVTKNMERS
ncbi:MAG: DUF1667 domain-containing protein [Lachnospiraceae bacterium]|jgi:CxxC motif-containing protein|nr:DUF1667 domain-containing protein [Lachnospiraceae bacterium]